ncbi:dTMP kinase [soil metagenome]
MKTVTRTANPTAAAPLIALIGSDGAGKSTVGTELLAWMRECRPTELCHLGKQTGNIARAVARWPIVGKKFDRVLDDKTKVAEAPSGPSTGIAIAIYLMSMRRVRRFRRMERLRGQGIAILADRFPQTDLPGAIDGPGLSGMVQRGAVTRALAAREQRYYAGMVAQKPDLVIRLTVDLATAVARKPDHRPNALAKKIASIAKLRFGGARIVDIDATQPLDHVLDQAKHAIAQVLATYPAVPGACA